MGDDAYGINPQTIAGIVGGDQEVADLGVQVGVVIGGGNIFRGVAGCGHGHGPCHRRLHGHAGDGDERAWRCRTRCARRA